MYSLMFGLCSQDPILTITIMLVTLEKEGKVGFTFFSIRNWTLFLTIICFWKEETFYNGNNLLFIALGLLSHPLFHISNNKLLLSMYLRYKGTLLHYLYKASQGKLNTHPVSVLNSTGSDRSNVVQLSDRLKNYPLSFENTTMWTNAQVKWIYFQDTPSISAKDLVINLATSGFYQ